MSSEETSSGAATHPFIFMLCVLHNSTPFMFIGLFLLVWLDSTRGKYFEDMSTTTAFVLMFGIGLIVFGIISGLFCLW